MPLRSMTGFGATRCEDAGVVVGVEARSVNGRFLKLSVKGPPVVRAIEHRLEAIARKRLQRGTVTLAIKLTPADPARLVAINEEVVSAYQSAFRRLGLSEESIPLLDGVIGSVETEQLDEAAAGVVEAAVVAALAALVAMREQEGRALSSILARVCDRIAELCASVRERAPDVVREYQARLSERLATLLGDSEAAVDAELVAREIAVFADKCDVTEEVDRIDAHLRQIRELLANGSGAGRRLDFLGQELLREANTIGSKSADAQLAHIVVEIKAVVEQLKEQSANVE